MLTYELCQTIENDRIVNGIIVDEFTHKTRTNEEITLYEVQVNDYTVIRRYDELNILA